MSLDFIRINKPAVRDMLIKMEEKNKENVTRNFGMYLNFIFFYIIRILRNQLNFALSNNFIF